MSDNIGSRNVMLVQHHNKIFKNEDIVLNGCFFHYCQFINCNVVVYPLEADADPTETVIAVIDCAFYSCTPRGEGWPPELLEVWGSEGKPINWRGDIPRKKKPTLH